MTCFMETLRSEGAVHAIKWQLQRRYLPPEGLRALAGQSAGSVVRRGQLRESNRTGNHGLIHHSVAHDRAQRQYLQGLRGDKASSVDR